MTQRITWERNEGIGRSGWTGTVDGRRLFTIEMSIRRGTGWVLRTRLPFGLVKQRAEDNDSDAVKEYAEVVLAVFVRSLLRAFMPDALKASYRDASEAHAGLYEGVDDPDAPEDNGWRQGPGPLRLADFFADLSGTGILDHLKD